MRVLWVRHGQMEFRASGSTDLSTINQYFNQERQGSLSRRGQQEAELVARYFRGIGVSAIYSSPLDRARETAEATAAMLDKDVTILEDAGELRTGHLAHDARASRAIDWLARHPRVPEKMKRQMLGALLVPLYFQSWRAGKTVGGESEDELRVRLNRIFGKLRANHGPDEEVAIFAHGYLIFYLSTVLSPLTPEQIKILRSPYIPNGSITEFELPEHGPPLLVRFAKAVHLTPLSEPT